MHNSDTITLTESEYNEMKAIVDETAYCKNSRN